MSCKMTGNGVLIEAKESNAPGATYEAIGCIYAATPPGLTYATVTAEQCLDETGTPSTDLGDAEASESTFTHAYCPGGAKTELIRQWANDKTLVDWRIRYPASVNCTIGVVENFKGRIRVFAPSEISKTEFMKLPVTILVDGNVSVVCLGQQVVDVAALTALPMAGLTNGQGVYLDNGDVYTWDSSATSGQEEPDDKANPGVDPGYWIKN